MSKQDRNVSPESAQKWELTGEWFDVCNCNIALPCEFAQAPTSGDCKGILAYHIRHGRYGEVSLDGLNLVRLVSFKGNFWAGEGKVKASLASFVDDRANPQQREAIRTIFSGKAGGFPAGFAKLVEGEFRGAEFAPIKFELDEKLKRWRVEVPGKVLGEAEALEGPMTPKGQLVQTLNPPGSEVGPGGVATWGKSVTARGGVWLHV